MRQQDWALLCTVAVLVLVLLLRGGKKTKSFL
jgi:hypothetical protein